MLHFFKVMGKLEGISLLLLLCVAMPLKYFVDFPLAVKIVGSLHGAFFVFYLTLGALLFKRMKWTVDTLVICVILASVPFGTFIFERKYL